jgi:hypothetical protein
MDLFTSVDTLNTSVFLHSVVQPDNSYAEQILLPVTRFSNNWQAVLPKGFGSDYGLYLVIAATGVVGTPGSPTTYSSLTATLWADPKNDAGAASSTAARGAAFSSGMANDIVLATGTLKSASMTMDPATLVRTADFVETMTPTLDGTILLDGSIKPGSTLEERLTTPPADFQSIPSAGGGSTILVNNATAQVTPQDPLQLPSISTESLGFAAMHFLHGTHFLHHL